MDKKKIAAIIGICTGFAGVIAVLIALQEHLTRLEIIEIDLDDEDDVFEDHGEGWEGEARHG